MTMQTRDEILINNVAFTARFRCSPFGIPQKDSHHLDSLAETSTRLVSATIPAVIALVGAPPSSLCLQRPFEVVIYQRRRT